MAQSTSRWSLQFTKETEISNVITISNFIIANISLLLSIGLEFSLDCEALLFNPWVSAIYLYKDAIFFHYVSHTFIYHARISFSFFLSYRYMYVGDRCGCSTQNERSNACRIRSRFKFGSSRFERNNTITRCGTIWYSCTRHIARLKRRR